MEILLNWIKKHIFKIDLRSNYEIAVSRGMKVGKNPSIQDGVSFDVSHCWLIELGDNVTIAPNVTLLAHDASTKRVLGYTVIGKIKIGDNVFVGANSTILPNVSIGNNVVIGAGSVVTHDIPENSVVAGNPARILKSYSKYIEERETLFSKSKLYGREYTIAGGVDDAKKLQMKEELRNGVGGVV